MNYSAKGSSSWKSQGEEYAPAHSASSGAAPQGTAQAGPEAPQDEDAHSLDHILLTLVHEARTLGIPLCGEFITAARQAIAERLRKDAADIEE